MLTDDNRKTMLDKIIKEHHYEESSLLEILHKAQEIYGFLDKNMLNYIARALSLPPSHVTGVATLLQLLQTQSSRRTRCHRLPRHRLLREEG